MSGSRVVALLRGVNVGGVAMPMAEVREAVGERGGRGVRTFLASGNIVLDAPEPAADTAQLVSGALHDRFGYTAWVWFGSLERVHAIIDGFPFETDEAAHHPYVTFADDGHLLDELAAAASPDGPAGDRAVRADGVLYWEAPRGGTLASALSKLSARSRYATTTTRDLRTLRKLA